MFLMGADIVEQNGDEREKLLEQHKQLSAVIERLTRERDYLVFQRAMYSSDSKYLVLNLSAKTGQLKYKNRVLKDVSFTLVSGRIRRLKPGALTLSQKIEGPRGRNLLAFGESLVLQGRKAPPIEFGVGIPRYSLSKKDFKSLYSALEPGAKAFLVH